MSDSKRLENFPISFFSIILGLAGFTIAVQRAEIILGLPVNIHFYLLIITAAIFIILGFSYLIKSILYRPAVIREFNHPIKISFFPTISISFLLFSVALLEKSREFSEILWITGTILQFLLTMKILSVWIQHEKFEIKHLNPAWFIPAVGNIIVPIAGTAHGYLDISWFFFSIGIIFVTAVGYSYPMAMAGNSLATQMVVPTLFILIAPPAIGFVSLVKLTGEISVFANILYYFGIFMLSLLFFQIKMFLKLKFFLSWWACSFPIAAITIASLLMYHKTGKEFTEILAYILLIVLAVTILVLSVRTIIEIKNKGICVEDD